MWSEVGGLMTWDPIEDFYSQDGAAMHHDDGQRTGQRSGHRLPQGAAIHRDRDGPRSAHPLPQGQQYIMIVMVREVVILFLKEQQYITMLVKEVIILFL